MVRSSWPMATTANVIGGNNIPALCRRFESRRRHQNLACASQKWRASRPISAWEAFAPQPFPQPAHARRAFGLQKCRTRCPARSAAGPPPSYPLLRSKALSSAYSSHFSPNGRVLNRTRRNRASRCHRNRDTAPRARACSEFWPRHRPGSQTSTFQRWRL